MMFRGLYDLTADHEKKGEGERRGRKKSGFCGPVREERNWFRG